MTSDLAAELRARIDSRSAVVGIIGLGYVGLPLAIAFTDKGFRVVGFDVDPVKVDKLARGESYIKHLDGDRLPRMLSSGLFEATTDFARLGEPDAILICVPTPLTRQREPDMRYVESSARQIAAALRPGQLIVLESTTYPGTTEDLLRPILEFPDLSLRGAARSAATKQSGRGSGGSEGEGGFGRGRGGSRGMGELPQSDDPDPQSLQCGRDFFLAFSPEREDPGNPFFGATNTPKVVGGVDETSADLAQALYDHVVASTVRVSSARAAEATKLTENVFRAVNIALVNELKIVYDRMGIDIWEVLDAAETKPFGFVRFNPGPGWGGHCLDGAEWVRVRGLGLSGLYRLSDLFTTLEPRCRALATAGGHYLRCRGLEALAIDPPTGEIGWFSVEVLYRGRYEGSGCEIRTADNRTLRVTDQHPMLVLTGDRFDTVPARDLAPGDHLPVVSDLGVASDDPVIDLMEAIPERKRVSVWVRHPQRPWKEFERQLKVRFGWKIRDSVRSNTLRLDRFFEIEGELGLDRSELLLITGMGRARRTWPTRLRVTPDIARFVGYYLAEGCITEEKNAIRVRLTFNRDEAEYLDDATAILKSLGFPVTRYNDATWHTTTLKISSLVLASLIDGHWHCGRRSEEMRIPDQIFHASPDHKREVLAGLLRGDGDVWTRTGQRHYRKKGKAYSHRDATAVVGFFSSSPVLLEQVTHLLQDFGYLPRFKRRKPQLHLQGAVTVHRLESFFAGRKLSRLRAARLNRRRVVRSHSDVPPLAPGLRSTSVGSIRPIAMSGWVYSMEVERASTFTSSKGIAVHNCIPLDPFYLAWKAREYGVSTKFIELAGEVNVRMPEYVVDKLEDALNEQGKCLRGARVLVLGLAYKKDIDDPRESPAFEIIDLLLKHGADLAYHDPHIPVAPRMRSWPHLPPLRSVDISDGSLPGYDAVVIVTDHTAVDYDRVAREARLVIDTRGVFRGNRRNVVKA
jgi:UDP-N-acetyl-D-mannosaminuronate dehydrogenase/intein/homing endonuclease